MAAAPASTQLRSHVGDTLARVPWASLVPVVLVAHVATALLFLLNRAPGTDAALTGLPLDDGWIHLVYARSVAALDGFCYNPGQPEAGFTSPLWVLVASPLFWLARFSGLDVIIGIKALGVLVAVATSLAAFRVAHRLTDRPGAGWLAALAVVADPSLSFAKVSGMEILLAGGLLLWALDGLLARSEVRAAIAAALVPLARPELATFTVVALAVLPVGHAERGGQPARGLALLLPTLVTLGTWAAFCLAVTGRPLPNTFYAKHAAGPLWERFADLPTVFGPMLFDLPWFFAGSGLLLFVLGARRVLRRDAPGEAWGRRAPRLVVVAYPVVFMLAIAWTHDLNQSWPFYWHRYFEPIIPWLVVVISVGAWDLGAWSLRQLRGPAEAPGARRALAAAACLPLLLPLTALPLRTLELSDRFAWNCQNINEMQVEIGRWLERHSAPSDWIATNDAGAIRYFSDRNVVDLVGLNNHDVLRRGAGRVVQEIRPRFLAVFPSWVPQVARDQSLVAVYGVRSPHYTICECAQDFMVVLTPRDSWQPPK